MCFEFQRVGFKQNLIPLHSFSSVLRVRAYSEEWPVAKDARVGPADANGGRYIKTTNRTVKTRTTTLTVNQAFLSALRRPFAVFSTCICWTRVRDSN